MNEAPLWFALISITSIFGIIAQKLGWIRYLSGIVKINDEFGILLPVSLFLTVPFLIAKLSDWLISNFDEIHNSGLLPPTATLVAASIAAFMVSRTIENSRQNERIKNTVSALDNKLFKSENLTKFEMACALLDQEIESEGSFKAVCRIPSRAREFTERFRSKHPEEYETIRDILKYSDTLCYGTKSGIYDEKMIQKFLGEIMFNAWWAAMIIIQNETFSYYSEMTKDYRRKPDFGRPYDSLSNWIDDISKEQNLEQVGFVLGRLSGGIEVFRMHPEWW